MVRTSVIGLGKMGISHCAILNAHKGVDVVGVCDTSKFLRWALGKYSPLKTYSSYKKMIEEQKPQSVFIATPTKLHYEIAKYCLDRDIHIFLEKPCCLNYEETTELRELASNKKLLVQIGYHNRYIGTFGAVKKAVENQELGEIYHFSAEAYGPVVINEQEETWRSKRSEGGGCLYDYASHVINLVDYLLGGIESVKGTVLRSVYSKNVEDAVYSTLKLMNGITGQLSVSWSEESYRKMSTKITIYGKKGRIEANAQEIKLYRNKSNTQNNHGSGWDLTYITDHTNPVEFYLRGEEYSAQIYDFIDHVETKNLNSINSIELSGETDRVVELLVKDDVEGKR